MDIPKVGSKKGSWRSMCVVYVAELVV